jgi:S-DNA-T family DNA segregation ATPase FtsK/SpoIIIE
MLMLRYGAPALTQIMMAVLMLVERRWLFALMVAPGLVTTLIAMLLAARTDTASSPAGMPSPSSITNQETQTPRDDMRTLALRTLESLLGVDEEPLMWRSVVRRWLQPGSLRVPVAVSSDGVYMLDLAGQGPHALVAGTTGSGKSVLLQSWCLSMAFANPPERLHFVFLDFKGGSAFNRLETLPHAVGSVCDLDLHHATRALLAVEQELERRERLVARQRVGDLRALPDRPAAMVIVVDEFHALSNQLPDYDDRLTRIASLGRSLDMHVIACTQNPLGQVSATMKANMSLNICLRVRDGVQSSELLGDTRAATIPPELPGGAYCADGGELTAIRCAQTHSIERLVRAMQLAHRFCGGRIAVPLFTAPLPRMVHSIAKHLGRSPTASRSAVPFALGDTGVALDAAMLPIGRGNIAVIGMQGRGKTTLLRTIYNQVCAVDGLDAVWFGGAAEASARKVSVAAELSAESVAGDRSTDSPHAHTPSPHAIWLVDDADAWFEPLCADPAASKLRSALADDAITVIFAVRTSRHIRIPEHCTTRVVMPTGERAVDLMNGIPANLLATFDAAAVQTPGRAALLRDGTATLVQCLGPRIQEQPEQSEQPEQPDKLDKLGENP